MNTAFPLKVFPQHQISTTLSRSCEKNRTTPALPCSLWAVLTSTPKPRAEGSSPSAPANSLVPRPCENRMAWGFFVPMRPWTRSINSQLMLHPVLSSHIRPQPVFTAVFPSSTQNAPGFAFFGLFRVRFFHFRCFSERKIFALVFVQPAHSAYKLKPSVITCRREVSFFT